MYILYILGLIGLWILGVVLVLLALKVCIWWVRIFYRAGLGWGDAVKQSFQPVPGPLQIEAALQNEWGRQPTVQEVQAVHQMLHQEHNQALLKSGVGAGALYLGSKWL